jgi:hypothetical protein
MRSSGLAKVLVPFFTSCQSDIEEETVPLLASLKWLKQDATSQ